MKSADFPPFPGFRPQALAFLRELAANNQREWFKPRKAVYDDEIWWPFQCLIADASRHAAFLGLPLSGDPDRALFRPYRDTRFSKNKEPYKTHAGGVLSRTGRRDAEGVVYIHVEPGASFLAAGFWQPDPALLRTWRRRMADEPEDFLDVTGSLDACGLSLDTGDTLKRLPQGYDAYAASPVAPFLRLKSFTVSRAVPDEALQEPAFTGAVVEMMRDAQPLLEYGWHLADTLPPR